MTWRVSGPRDGVPFVEFVIAGDIGSRGLSDSFSELLRCCQEHQTWRMLTDLSALTGGHTVVDLFGLVEELTRLGVADRFREAVVRPIGSSVGDRAQFWEDATVNRGLRVQLFEDRPSAIAWLTA